jgi:hypothetical protein
MTSLAGVRSVLATINTEHLSLFTSLIGEDKITKLSPYASKEYVRRRVGFVGPDYLWQPMLGKKQAPVGLPKLSTLKDLQEICLRDLPETRDYYGDRLVYFAQSGSIHDSSVSSAEDAGMQTIDSLTDASLASSETIVTFPSETLEEMCSGGLELPPNLLRVSMTTCTVLPADTLLPLHHSNEGTTVTTLLSGSIAWIVWPPTDHNIRTMQTAYEAYAEDFDETKLDVAGDLEGGIIFLQGEGEGVRIPPFSPMMSLALKTSVLATKNHVTVENFISMLQKLPLLKAWFETEADGERSLTTFNASVLRYLDFMLNGSEDHEERNLLKLRRTKDGFLGSLLSIWDSIKNDLAAMMGPAESETMGNIWEAFLISAVGRECWICQKRISPKQKLMKKHFVAAHWTTVKEANRIDSMEVTEEIVGTDEVEGQAEEAGMSGDGAEEAMEVDE